MAPIVSDGELWDCTSDAASFGNGADSALEYLETNSQLGGATGPDARCLQVTTSVCLRGDSATCSEWPALCAATSCNAAGSIVVTFQQGARNATVTCKQQGARRSLAT